jgi:hypothetical protein
MGGRHALAAALVSMLAGIVLVVGTAADQSSDSDSAAALNPVKPLIVVTMLPAAQRQVLAVAPLATQVLRCAAQQQQQQPFAVSGAADSQAATTTAMSSPLHATLSSAADTLHKALTGGAPF